MVGSLFSIFNCMFIKKIILDSFWFFLFAKKDTINLQLEDLFDPKLCVWERERESERDAEKGADKVKRTKTLKMLKVFIKDVQSFVHQSKNNILTFSCYMKMFFFAVSSGRGVNRDFEMLVEFLSGSSLVHSAIASPWKCC